MKNYLEHFRGVLFLFWLSLLINIITWLIVLLKIRPSADQVIPLHYNIFYGTDFAGQAILAYTIPLIGLIILLANFLFYKYSLNKEQFGAKILLAVGLVAQIAILAEVLFLRSKIII